MFVLIYNTTSNDNPETRYASHVELFPGGALVENEETHALFYTTCPVEFRDLNDGDIIAVNTRPTERAWLISKKGIALGNTWE